MVVPNTTTMGFPTKKEHFGAFWGYHHLRKPPYGCGSPWGSLADEKKIQERHEKTWQCNCTVEKLLTKSRNVSGKVICFDWNLDGTIDNEEYEELGFLAGWIPPNKYIFSVIRLRDQSPTKVPVNFLRSLLTGREGHEQITVIWDIRNPTHLLRCCQGQALHCRMPNTKTKQHKLSWCLLESEKNINNLHKWFMSQIVFL